MTANTLANSTTLSPNINYQKRVDYIDVLRGAACLWVLFHHSVSSFIAVPGPGQKSAELLTLFSKLGWLGVSIFLVLSGFCLYFPLARKFEPNEVRLSAADFFKRRAKRILPPFYSAYFALVVLAFVRLHGQTGHWNFHVVTIPGVMTHLLMIFNLSPRTIANINTSFWSIALESQLYLIFPVLVWGFGKFGFKKTLAATFSISLLWQLFCYHKLGLSKEWTPIYAVYYHSLPARCFEFAAGMVSAHFCARPRPNQYKYAVMFISVLIIPSVYFVAEISRFAPLIDQAWGIIFASVLVLLSRIPDRVFHASWIGQRFVWLGTISYSVYLIHQPLIALVTPSHFHVHSQYAARLLGIPCIIAVGYLFHLVFERPFMTTKPKTARNLEIAAAENPAP